MIEKLLPLTSSSVRAGVRLRSVQRDRRELRLLYLRWRDFRYLNEREGQVTIFCRLVKERGFSDRSRWARFSTLWAQLQSISTRPERTRTRDFREPNNQRWSFWKEGRRREGSTVTSSSTRALTVDASRNSGCPEGWTTSTVDEIMLIVFKFNRDRKGRTALMNDEEIMTLLKMSYLDELENSQIQI